MSMMTCLSAAFVLALVMWFYLIWEKKYRDKAARQAGASTEHQSDAEVNQMDKTDKELPQFRYVY